MARFQNFKPGGENEYIDGWGVISTDYTSTCNHCQAITQFPSRRNMMDHVEMCRGCMRLICLNCIGKPCIPFEKKVDLKEKEDELLAKLARERWGCY